MQNRPPSPQTQAPSVVISNWKVFAKNTLRGFFTITLPSGLAIHNCTLHQKNASRWIGLPARPYKKQDGSQAWMPMVEFVSRERADNFRDEVLQALGEKGIF